VHHKPYRLLKQLLIPEKPWNSISMDFIEKLPPSSITPHPSHCLIISQSSHSLFGLMIPLHPATCTIVRPPCFLQTWCPSHVTSDSSTEFVSHFFQSLGTTLDMKLHFTSRYHPKVMDKLNKLIRLWNSISKSIATTNKTTGLNSFH